MELTEELCLKKQFEQKTGKKFDDYYLKFYPKLIYTVQKMNINQIDAEDIANQAFIKSLQKINQYKPEYEYSTWLFRIGINIANKFKNDSTKTILVDTSASGNEDDVSGLQYYLNTQIDETNDDQSYETMHDLKYNETLKEISELSPKYKNIIEMCDIYGLSYNEITEETGETLQTVKNRLHHGRKKIKSKLKNKFNYIVKSY